MFHMNTIKQYTKKSLKTILNSFEFQVCTQPFFLFKQDKCNIRLWYHMKVGLLGGGEVENMLWHLIVQDITLIIIILQPLLNYTHYSRLFSKICITNLLFKLYIKPYNLISLINKRYWRITNMSKLQTNLYFEQITVSTSIYNCNKQECSLGVV